MKDRPSAMRIAGQTADFEELMPLVLINPVVEAFGRTRVESEGCLSFPGLRGDVPRPFSVRVKARSIDGQDIEFEADGFLARAGCLDFAGGDVVHVCAGFSGLAASVAGVTEITDKMM